MPKEGAFAALDLFPFHSNPCMHKHKQRCHDDGRRCRRAVHTDADADSERKQAH
jgi:hypothetical protein